MKRVNHLSRYDELGQDVVDEIIAKRREEGRLRVLLMQPRHEEIVAQHLEDVVIRDKSRRQRREEKERIARGKRDGESMKERMRHAA